MDEEAMQDVQPLSSLEERMNQVQQEDMRRYPLDGPFRTDKVIMDGKIGRAHV